MIVKEEFFCDALDEIDRLFCMFREYCDKPEDRPRDFVGLFIEALDSSIADYLDEEEEIDDVNCSLSAVAEFVAKSFADLPDKDSRDKMADEYRSIFYHLYTHNFERIVGPLIFYLKKRILEGKDYD